MATIDYKEKYEAALAVAQETYKTQPMYREWLAKMFPELAESEDERIRKELIKGISKTRPNTSFLDTNITREEALVWLEKQGENERKSLIWKHWKDGIAGNGEGRPIYLIKSGLHYSVSSCLGFECDYIELTELDKLLSEKQGEQPNINPDDLVLDLAKRGISPISIQAAIYRMGVEDAIKELKGEQKSAIQPKFHEGDWAVSNLDGKARQISEVHFDEYNSYYVVDGKSVNLEEYDRLHHLWTIQDAKDGDVLAAHECYVIFKEIDGLNIKCYCTYHYLGLNPSFYVDTLQNKTAFHPATKKQREFLFKKMHDAGYEWDAEKLELRKVEQKIEEKPLISLTDFQKAFELKAKQYDINLPSRGYDIHAMCKELYSLLTKQKPAEWSEEDEQYLLVCKNALAKYQRTDKWDASIISRWLESLKDRVQPQPRQEWSEEDEKYFNSIAHALSVLLVDPSFDEINLEHTAWFQSLKERVQPHPKQEWSEEDDVKINRIVTCLELQVNNPVTSADRGHAEEIIFNLKKVEEDYNLDLTKEIEWLRNKAQKGE